ncbi:MAG: putative cytochrome c oxidase subunit [Acidimicrobiales bacterium]|nr:putative cytochrome c oxidase subunit [Acidimicrobiales bacterium]
MAVTETAPAAAPAAAETAPTAPHREVTGLAGVLGSGDHKVTGRLYIGFSVLFGLSVAVAGVLTNLERLDTSSISILSTDTYAQVLSYHDVAFPYLTIAPLLLGIALVIVPLQVGAGSVAFPRAAAASVWTWLVGSGLLAAAYAINGGPGGGRASGVDLFVVALGIVLVSLLLGAVCVATTVLALRTPGMSLARVPLFAWSALVASVLWLLSLPVLFGTLVLAYVDHRHSQTSFGQNGEIAGHIAWAMSHPQVSLLVVPVLGFAGDVLAATARVRLAFRSVAMAAIAAFGILSYGAYLQSSDASLVREPFSIGTSVLALLPLLVLVALFADLFRRGSFRLIAPAAYAVSALLVLLLGVAAGAVHAAANTRASLHFGPAADAGITHAILFAGIIGGLGALDWWATKVLRRPLGAPLGLLAPLLMLVGASVYAIADIISGWTGNAAEKVAGIEALNAVALVGLLIALGGVGLAVLNLLAGLKPGTDVASDPWEGQTLEWATASPPARANFAEVPSVGSAEPLLDQREEKS